MGALAVIFASDDPDRLYVGFSMLVSTAAEGEPASALLTLRARPAMPALDPDLWQTVEETGVKVYACEPSEFELSSIPRFLKATKDARLVVV